MQTDCASSLDLCTRSERSVARHMASSCSAVRSPASSSIVSSNCCCRARARVASSTSRESWSKRLSLSCDLVCSLE